MAKRLQMQMNDSGVEIVLAKSSQLYAERKHDEAVTLLTEALKDHHDARLYYHRGRHLDALEEPQQAVADYTAAIERNPAEAKYYLRRGFLYAEVLDKNQAAIRDFDKVIELQPDNVEAHRQCCLSSLLMGLPEKAWSHAKADDVTPVYTDPLRIGRDTVLVMEGFRYFQRTLNLDPDFRAPAALRPNVAEIRTDLVQYAGQDFRGLPSIGDGKDRRVAAWQTVILLERFEGLDAASKEPYQDGYPYIQAKQWLVQGHVFA